MIDTASEHPALGLRHLSNFVKSERFTKATHPWVDWESFHV